MVEKRQMSMWVLKSHVCEKDYVRNPATCDWKNGKYLTSILDNSVIICDEITGMEETSFNEKNIIHKTEKIYILLAFC